MGNNGVEVKQVDTAPSTASLHMPHKERHMTLKFMTSTSTLRLSHHRSSSLRQHSFALAVCGWPCPAIIIAQCSVIIGVKPLSDMWHRDVQE